MAQLDDRARIGRDLGEAWGDVLRAREATLAVRRAVDYRMAAAIAEAVAELDPSHFHDPLPGPGPQPVGGVILGPDARPLDEAEDIGVTERIR